MTEATEYECNDCGHTFESIQEYPQCGLSDCRSRNLTETESDDGSDPSPEQPQQSGERMDDGSDGHGGATKDSPDDPTNESEDQEGDGDEWTPLFDTEETDERDDEPEEYSPPTGGESEGGSTGVTPPSLNAEDLQPIIDSSFDAVADRRGEHWKLSDDESERMADAYAALGQKYVPYMLAEHTVELTAVVVTGTIVLPRLQTDKDQSDSEDETHGEQTDDGTEGSVADFDRADSLIEDRGSPSGPDADATTGAWANV